MGRPIPDSASIVRLVPPLDLSASLEGFRRWGDDGLDRWDGRRLLRTAPIGGRTVAYRAVDVGQTDAPAIKLQPEPSEDRELPNRVAEAVRATFLVAPPEFRDLLERDAIVGRANARFPGLRPVVQPDLFTALVRSVTAQQLSLRWAAVIRGRLAESFGDRHDLGGDWVRSLSRVRLAAAQPEDLRALQLSNRQSGTIIAIARASLNGELDQSALASMPDHGVIEHLVQLHGIGRWSAEWILARTFGRPVVVAGDLGVRKAVGREYLGVALATEDEVRRVTAHWGASAGVAQTLLLAGLAAAAKDR